jgi:hypothetical protein
VPVGGIRARSSPPSVEIVPVARSRLGSPRLSLWGWGREVNYELIHFLPLAGLVFAGVVWLMLRNCV